MVGRPLEPCPICGSRQAPTLLHPTAPFGWKIVCDMTKAGCGLGIERAERLHVIAAWEIRALRDGHDLRDRFAGQAMQGILAGGWADTVPLDDPTHGSQLAFFAYAAADAMLIGRGEASRNSREFVPYTSGGFAQGEAVEVRERNGDTTVMEIGSADFRDALAMLGDGMMVRRLTDDQERSWRSGR